MSALDEARELYSGSELFGVFVGGDVEWYEHEFDAREAAERLPGAIVITARLEITA